MEEMSVLIARSQAGERNAREVLIENNLGLVRHIVKRFAGRGHDLEDLFQIGTIGLMKAIDKFDLSLGLKFSTYAVPMITGEIKRFLRDDGPVKVSRTIKENGIRVKIENGKVEVTEITEGAGDVNADSQNKGSKTDKEKAKGTACPHNWTYELERQATAKQDSLLFLYNLP